MKQIVSHTLSDFQVPQSQKVECTLINECIADSSIIQNVRTTVKPYMFYDEQAKAIWETLLSMYDNGEGIDLMSVYHKVDSKYLTSNVITCDSGSMLAATEHAAIIANLYIKRQAYFSALDTLMKVNSNSTTTEEIIAIPQKFSESMMSVLQREETKSITEVINELADDMQNNKVIQVPSGFGSIDFLTYGGFSGGDLVILAARPSVGKTAVMLQMARESSRFAPALCLSLEMTGKQLGKRMMYATHYITPETCNRQNMDWENFERAAAEFDNRPLYIDDKANSIEEVCASITINHQKGKCNIAFVDYLGLVEDESDNTDKLAVSLAKKTRRLKRLAIQLGIPIVLLCQLNRNSDREKRAPEMHDLRDSGAIEQDADIVLMLERTRDESSNEQMEHRVTMWVRKNRNGRAGQLRIDLETDETYSNFTELR